MLRKTGLLFAALAMFSIAGGHRAVMQSVAWGQMLADYTRASGSLVVGIEQTFDGEHPCELCVELQTVKAKGKPGSVALNLKEDAKLKAGLLNPAPPTVPRVASAVSFPSDVTFGLSSRVESPPTPPPRPVALAA